MADKQSKSRGLGRGLSALMSDINQAQQDADAPANRIDLEVPIERIRPNPDQPRKTFNDAAIAELADSIREKGIIQPLIVRRDPSHGGDYQIVAGERRWRAAQRANFHQIPVIIKDFSDVEVLEIAIIENIQRADLNAIDEAAGYRQLMERFGHSQEQLGKALGKSRSHIANMMRLLTLPETVQTYVAQGDLSAGHARALIGRDNPTELAKKIIREGLSVRAVENLVKRQENKGKKQEAAPARGGKDADTLQIERELAATLGMHVSISHEVGAESGTIALRYKTLEQLDDLLRLLSGA